MPNSTHPMVDVTDIIRIVGGAAFQRGQTYAKDGAVSSLAWDAESRLLTGKVRGTAPNDYRTKLRLGLKGDGRFRPLENFCSCPIGADCKHVAATALQSNTENLLAQHERDLGARSAARTSVPEGWQASLTDLLDADPAVDAPPAPRVGPARIPLRRDSTADRGNAWDRAGGIQQDRGRTQKQSGRNCGTHVEGAASALIDHAGRCT